MKKILFISLQLSIIAGNSFAGSLIGFSYNAITDKEEIRTIDPATGKTTLLTSLSIPGWSGGAGFYANTFISDPASGRFSVIGADSKLYSFSITTGVLLSSPTLDYPMQTIGVAGNGYYVGFSYNSTVGKEEVRTVDPTSGATTLLSTLSIPGWSGGAGFYGHTFTSDSSSGKFSVVGGDSKLYSFSLITGELLSSPSLDKPMQTIDVTGNGYYIGFSYNLTVDKEEVRTVDPTSGATTLLSTLSIPGWSDGAGFYGHTFTSDPSSGNFSVVGGDSKLYSFSLTTGELLFSPVLDSPMQTTAITIPEPSVFLFSIVGIFQILMMRKLNAHIGQSSFNLLN